MEKRKGSEEVLFGNLMTESEKVVLGKRLMAQLLLMSGWTVLEVSKELKLSSASIYRYMQMMKSEGYEEELKRLFPVEIERPKPGSEPDLGEGIARFLDDMWRGRTERWRLKYPHDSYD